MTRARLNRIVTVACAAMILCWFDTLNRLVMPGLSCMPLPVPKVALILLWSGIVSFIITSWSPRRWGIIVLHGIGFLAALALVLDGSGDPAYPFYDFSWVTRGAGPSWALWQWLKFLVNFIWAGALYYLGYHLYSRKIDFYTVIDRFDIGISVFFVVLIVKLVAGIKGWVIPYEHTLVRQFVCFLVLALFSIGITRNRTSHADSTISYNKGAGLVMSFIMLAFVFSTTAVMLFLPDMMEGALVGKEMLGRGWPWLEHMASLFVNFDLAAKPFDPSIADQIIAKMFPGADMTIGTPNLVYFKVMSCFGYLFALVALWFAFEWVLHKLGEKGGKTGSRVVFRIMIGRLKRFYAHMVRLLFSRRDPLHRIEQYYRLLQKWGERSGLPCVACETPNEYGRRLAGNFPDVAPEIGNLIVLFNHARYGGIPVQRGQFKQIQADWKRLRSPALWPVRAKLWLIQART